MFQGIFGWKGQILVKEPAPILLDFFQIYCDFGSIRIVIIFLIIILKCHALIPCLLEENIKNVPILLITVVYNHYIKLQSSVMWVATAVHLDPYFFLVAFIILSNSLLGGEAPIRMEPACCLVITTTSAFKRDIIKSPVQLNFHVNLSNSWIFYYF